MIAQFHQNSVYLTHPTYRPDIDGLRAVAILSVVGFHAFPAWVNGGFVGVDIFFVISGYLISTIIIGSLERDSFSFAKFYIRRINRIFPALLLVLIACFAFGWFALLPDEYKLLGKHIAGGAGFISNFLFWNESGYFDNATETKPLLHLWSLGVEEQFYIAWPLMLWFAWKQRLNLLTIIIVVALISFALNIAKVNGGHTDAAFYSPQTRFWELLIGSVLAYLVSHKHKYSSTLKQRIDVWFDKWLGPLVYAHPVEANGSTLRNILSLLGAALIAVSIFCITKEKAFPGWWAILPTGGTFLIISAGNQAWLNRVVLSNRALVWLGLISFPLYLWHWPLLSFARILESETPSLKLRTAAVLVAIVLAWLTYKLIEKPIRFGKYGNSKAIMLAMLMVVVGYIGYNAYSRDGLPFRDKISAQNKTQSEYEKSFYSNKFCRDAYPNYHGFYCVKTKDSKPTIQILGDSHANRLVMGLSEFTNETILNLGQGGCPPFIDMASPPKRNGYDDCAALTNQALEIAENTDSIKTLIVHFAGVEYFYSPIRFVSLVNNPKITDIREIFSIAMRNTLNRLIEKRKKIIFVLDHPEIHFDPQSCVDNRPLRLSNFSLRTSNHSVRRPCAISKDYFAKTQNLYREIMLAVLKEYPMVQVFDASRLFCNGQLCYAMKDGVVLYGDWSHVTLGGSQLIGKPLSQLIQD